MKKLEINELERINAASGASCFFAGLGVLGLASGNPIGMAIGVASSYHFANCIIRG